MCTPPKNPEDDFKDPLRACEEAVNKAGIYGGIAQTFEHKTEKVGQVEYEARWDGTDATKLMTTQYLADITLLVSPTAIRDKFARAVKNSRQDVWTTKIVNHGL